MSEKSITENEEKDIMKVLKKFKQYKLKVHQYPNITGNWVAEFYIFEGEKQIAEFFHKEEAEKYINFIEFIFMVANKNPELIKKEFKFNFLKDLSDYAKELQDHILQNKLKAYELIKDINEKVKK